LAQDTTTLTIDVLSVLKGLEKTLKGLAQIRKQLQSVVNVKAGSGQATANINKAAAATQRLQQQQQRAQIATQRLAQQQQQLAIRAQQLANAQTRAQQTTQRLAQSQQRLAATATTSARVLSQVGNAARSLGQGLASAGATLSFSLTPTLIGLGAATVNAAVQMDSLKRGLTAIVGSSDEANRQLQRLTQIAKLPGIGFQEAIQGSIRLQAVGFSAAEAERNLREFSNAIALTGGGRDELARVTVQLGQLAAKGKVLSQDLRPIIEAAPAVGRALLQAFGTVNPDDIRELGLTTKEFLDILVGELRNLPRAAAGAKNSFENFRDELFRAGAVIGESVLPALTRLVEVVGPIVTGLADAFGALPRPLQVVVFGVGALLAALGPVLFITGQLVLAVGRLTVGFVQLNVAGIGPTIASLRALTAGTLSAAAAQRTLAATSALVTAGVGAGLAVIAAAVTAYAVYNAFQKDAVALSKERADQLVAEIKSLQEQAKFLSNLQSGVQRTADEQQRLSSIYDSLNTQAKIRVAGITDEEKRLIALRAELEKVVKLRGEERVQQAANIAAQIAESAASIAANEKSRLSIAGRIAANNALVETLEREGRVTLETGRQLERLGVTAGGDVRLAINALQVESARLVARQKELGDNTEETKGVLDDYLAALRALDPHQQLTARQLLTLAKNMGLFEGNIEDMVPVLERYIQKTNEAAQSTSALNRSLSEAAIGLLKSGDKADAAAKSRRSLIEAAAAEARELAVDFAGAQREIQRTVNMVPELRQALQRESEQTGKSMEELLRDALDNAFKGRERSKSGTALRNAQEQLQQALAETAQASAEEQGAIERLKNENLLRINENSFKLQIIAYREYLNERARLTSANLQLEINAQRAIAADALAEQQRLTARSGQRGLPQVERTKAETGTAQAEERAIQARTKILELEQQQRDALAEVGQALAEQSKQQLADTRQLEIEFAELRGSIEAAANAATDERFREQLEQLGRSQAFLNKLENEFADILTREQKGDIAGEKAANQRQIDAINNIKGQEDALGSLAAARELVRRAVERQAQLEADLTFQVEFRGLTEEIAIAKRLEGERKLNDSLTIAHETIRQIVTALQARGVQPPRALIEFLDELRTQTQGLGDLPFTEQFRLAQKEFDRINDERIQKIADVERAVRNRDIAEVEGAIVIRRVNNQYTGDLERQLQLLQQIATASRDRGLQQQASDAAETVKDTKDEVAGLIDQIDAAGKDAFRSGLTDFFSDILSRTATAKEALLDLVNSVARAMSDVIAENLSRQLFESLFGGPEDAAGGLVATVKRLFGFGGEQGAGAAGGVAGAAVQATEATAASAALTTGATAAATALATGGATAGTTIVASVATAATAFATAVTAAGAAFAATVAASSASQAVGGLGAAFGAAATGLFPAVPGGVYKVVEGGYPEAVLTTDPRHAVRQVGILREYLKQTRGLFGRMPQLASGGFISREAAEANVLRGIERAPSSLTSIPAGALAGGPSAGTLMQRLIVVDKRRFADYLSDPETANAFIAFIGQNRPAIRRMLIPLGRGF
jgi:tape measure domain-containing protein